LLDSALEEACAAPP
jgi:hypothetical protein